MKSLKTEKQHSTKPQKMVFGGSLNILLVGLLLACVAPQAQAQVVLAVEQAAMANGTPVVLPRILRSATVVSGTDGVYTFNSGAGTSSVSGSSPVTILSQSITPNDFSVTTIGGIGPLELVTADNVVRLQASSPTVFVNTVTSTATWTTAAASTATATVSQDVSFTIVQPGQSLSSIITQYTSPQQSIAPGTGFLTLAHGLGTAPDTVAIVLHCISPDLGYPVGAEVFYPATQNQGFGGITHGMTVQFDANNLYLNYTALTLVPNGNPNGAGNIDPTKWELIAKAWGSSTTTTGTGGTASLLTGGQAVAVNVSRKSTTVETTQLLAFKLAAVTNATLSRLSINVLNTGTNATNLGSLNLFQDTDDTGAYSANDTLLATTTNAGTWANFYGLSASLNQTNNTFFLVSSFTPSAQEKNTYIYASLAPQNIVVQLSGTNVFVQTSGPSLIGHQYAFVDTTAAEDAAAAAALFNQINSAVSGATNALSAQYAIDLNAAIAAGTSRNASSSSTRKTGLLESTLPAAAAGAAAIGAAFTSDALNKGSYSREFTPRQ